MKHRLVRVVLAMLIAAVSACTFNPPDPDNDPLVIMPGLGPL